MPYNVLGPDEGIPVNAEQNRDPIPRYMLSCAFLSAALGAFGGGSPGAGRTVQTERSGRIRPREPRNTTLA